MGRDASLGHAGQVQWQDQELMENGHRLTFEQEQTADQLLADIQSAVDEMLLDFQTSPIVSPEPPSPAAAAKTNVSLAVATSCVYIQSRLVTCCRFNPRL